MVGGERAQAFTLEGFIGSVLLLTALLFAIQSVVITPTTSGAVDESVQNNLKQQAQDTLVVSADDGDLSYLVRYTSQDTLDSTNNKVFANSTSRTVGYGSDLENMSDRTRLPGLLNGTFKQRGRVFNVIVEYRGTSPGDAGTEPLVYQGVPSDNAVVASYTVPLFDDQPATGPNANGETLSELGSGYPIPDAYPDSPLYNLVEIRVVVW